MSQTKQIDRVELLGRHDVSSEAKVYILDTSALLHNYQILNKLKDNIKVIPLVVLDELDNYKTKPTEQGRNARSVIRYLDSLRDKGFLRDGQPDEVDGIVFVDYNKNDLSKLPGSMEINNDARIILVAVEWQEEFPDKYIETISEDINFRLRADACGIKCEGYKREKVSADEFYTGIAKPPVTSREIDLIYKDKEIVINEHNVFDGEMFFPNQFFLLKQGSQSAVARYNGNGSIFLLSGASDLGIGFKTRNVEQRFAMDLLSDEKVEITTLSGNAGSGKTLLALAAGLHEVLVRKKYERILVFRPLIPMGKDLGYMPGDKGEKLDHWMGPIYSKLETIAKIKFDTEKGPAIGVGKKAAQGRKEDVKAYAQKLIDDGIVEMEALTYTRGADIDNTYIVVDEAQNLTPHEIKTIVSRAGEDTKMVLTGDPYQIDSPYLDAGSNGLSYLIERFKHLPCSGHVTLVKGLRSKLAEAASELL